MPVIGKNRDRKAKAKAAFATLNNKAAFDALSASQKAELIRQAIVFLLKRELKEEAEG